MLQRGTQGVCFPGHKIQTPLETKKAITTACRFSGCVRSEASVCVLAVEVIFLGA